MAKAGRHAVTLHVAVDLASPRICVNTTSPAMVETPAYELSVPKAPDHAQADWEAEV
jgi:NAD(P)-dependent dehydrogenase (short-subunit alcohol dehydrogenase family)